MAFMLVARRCRRIAAGEVRWPLLPRAPPATTTTMKGLSQNIEAVEPITPVSRKHCKYTSDARRNAYNNCNRSSNCNDNLYQHLRSFNLTITTFLLIRRHKQQQNDDIDSPPRKQILRRKQSHWVGDGFNVFPVFADKAFTEELSPFLMFDYAAPKKFSANNGPPKGVGQVSRLSPHCHCERI